LVTCMKKICVDVYMLEQDEIKTPKQWKNVLDLIV
jgi:hypothetical protein